MKHYVHAEPGSEEPRAHPWDEAESNPSHRYYDFRAKPELIRTHLEDFCQWDSWPAIETFYALLEWLNGPESVFESNDCAFKGPRSNSDPKFSKAFYCSGRLMILFRSLVLNTSAKHVEWLHGAIQHYLDSTDPHFKWGVIGTTRMKVRYVSLPAVSEAQLGEQLMLSFWAWGDTDAETMMNLNRLLGNVWVVIRNVSNEVAEALSSSSP